MSDVMVTVLIILSYYYAITKQHAAADVMNIKYQC